MPDALALPAALLAIYVWQEWRHSRERREWRAREHGYLLRLGVTVSDPDRKPRKVKRAPTDGTPRAWWTV